MTYKDLEPSRLKLSGLAQWDPSPFLDDALWMAFKEPGSLRWTSDFDQDDLPDLAREDPDKILQLARIWDVNCLLHLAPPIIEEHLVPSCLRIFNCHKSSLVDRQIGDRRGANQLEAYLPGPSRHLPCGYHLGVLEVDPKTETVITCISDRRDFYHQLAVSHQRACSNKLWPPIPLDYLVGTKAFEEYGCGIRRRPRRLIASFEEIILLTSLEKAAPYLTLVLLRRWFSAASTRWFKGTT